MNKLFSPRRHGGTERYHPVWTFSVPPRLRGILLIVSVFYLACQNPRQPVAPAFYHWKTQLALSPAETAYLDTLGCRKLYVKTLDIGRDATTGEIQPYSLLEVADTAGLSGKTIVPCVFITNSVFQHITAEKIDWLARKTAKAIADTGRPFAPAGFTEIQFDCDWTATTRAAFFSFLSNIKKQLPAGIRLSATIRLHQYKFPERTGIPPVDRGMLMLYNTGDIEDWATENSIFAPADAEKYLKGAPAHYPLPLDLALPVFSWALVYRDDELWKIVPDPAPGTFADTTRFESLPVALNPASPPDVSEPTVYRPPSTVYRIRQHTFLAGHYLRTGDLIRVENIDTARLREAAVLAARVARAADATVAFYHLEPSTVHYFPAKWLKTVCETINTAK